MKLAETEEAKCGWPLWGIAKSRWHGVGWRIAVAQKQPSYMGPQIGRPSPPPGRAALPAGNHGNPLGRVIVGFFTFRSIPPT